MRPSEYVDMSSRFRQQQEKRFVTPEEVGEFLSLAKDDPDNSTHWVEDEDPNRQIAKIAACEAMRTAKGRVFSLEEAGLLRVKGAKEQTILEDGLEEFLRQTIESWKHQGL